MTPRLLRIATAYRSDQEQALDAYATLLLAIMEGDRSLFIRFDQVEVAWQVLEPVIRRWRGNGDDLHSYRAGSWGPEEANRLFEQGHQRWRIGP